MGIKRKKLRIGKKIPLASTNQKTTFIYKVELQSIIRLLELVSMKYFVEIDNGGRLKTKLYDKRDDFTFPIINFPFISSNIPAAPAYGVYISQRIRYSRACAQYSDFLDRVQLLTQNLLKPGYIAPRLKSSLQR
jgi:hypothetical protein